MKKRGRRNPVPLFLLLRSSKLSYCEKFVLSGQPPIRFSSAMHVQLCGGATMKTFAPLTLLVLFSLSFTVNAY